MGDGVIYIHMGIGKMRRLRINWGKSGRWRWKKNRQTCSNYRWFAWLMELMQRLFSREIRESISIGSVYVSVDWEFLKSQSPRKVQLQFKKKCNSNELHFSGRKVQLHISPRKVQLMHIFMGDWDIRKNQAHENFLSLFHLRKSTTAVQKKCN